MFNSYGELKSLKDIFLSKFDPTKVYEWIREYKSGYLLELFDIKQIDTLKPDQIISLMSNYKSNVIRAYNNRTKHKMLQSILDYCYDARKLPEQPMTVNEKDLDWLLWVIHADVCVVSDLMKGRFKLSKGARERLITRASLTEISHFTKQLSEKELARVVDRNIEAIKFLKKPTVAMLRKYYEVNKWGGRYPVVDYYPADLLVDMANTQAITKDIIDLNDKRFGGLVSVYHKLIKNPEWNKDWGIEKTNDEELKNFADLCDNDKEMIKNYVKEKLLSIK
jgi:hypothetical protein